MIPFRIVKLEWLRMQYRPPQRLIRMGRFRYPASLFLPSRRSCPPKSLVSADDLVEQCSSVRAVRVDDCPALQAMQYRTLGVCDQQLLEVCEIPETRAFCLEAEGARSVGRNCALISPDGRAVRETGYHLDADEVAQSMRLGRFHPRYTKYRWEGDLTFRRWLPPLQTFNGSVAALNRCMSANYYHWHVDVLVRLMILRRAGISADAYVLDNISGFHRETLNALGISGDKLIPAHDGLHLKPDRLIGCWETDWQAVRDVGMQLTKAFGCEAVRGDRRIFISRQRAKTRRLVNEEALLAALKRHRFERHFLEDYSVAEQVRLFREAEVIVGMHGAGLTNTIYCHPDTAVIELMPEGRSNHMLYPALSQKLGLSHWVVFAPRVGLRKFVAAPIPDVLRSVDEATSIRATSIRATSPTWKRSA